MISNLAVSVPVLPQVLVTKINAQLAEEAKELKLE